MFLRITLHVLIAVGALSMATPATAQTADGADPTVLEGLAGEVGTAGSGCPSLSGASGTSSQIYYTFTWINDGCPTPIRKGFYTRDGFGWDHIEFRRIVDGQINHETTAYAREKWAYALMTSGKLQTTTLMCHHHWYQTPGGTKRTMKVIHSSTNYEGVWGRKGIITAYWTSGHVNPC